MMHKVLFSKKKNFFSTHNQFVLLNVNDVLDSDFRFDFDFLFVFD